MNIRNEGDRHLYLSRRSFLKLSGLVPAVLLPLPHPIETGTTFTRGEPIRTVETDKPHVAVTIDDGNYPAEVERFLTLADRYQTKCTVFPYGLAMTKNQKLWREVYEQRHEIGNHSHSHLNVSGSTRSVILRDFDQFESEDYPSVIGLPFPDPGLARVPFAQGPVNLDVQSVIRQLHDLHVHWQLDSYSWKKGGRYSKANLEYVLARMAEVKAGDIIILHFVPLDITALPWILDLLSQKGLENVTFTKLWRNRKQVMKKRK